MTNDQPSPDSRLLTTGYCLLFSLTLRANFMQVHEQYSQLPEFRNAVVTIGTFDGVHLGHRKILDQLKQEARRVQGETVLITFHPHPRQVIRSGAHPVPQLNTIAEKKQLLEAAGLDHLVIVPFTEAFSKLSATAYIENFLIRYFHPHILIIGYDHHFGAGREGNYALLETYQAKGAFQLLEISEHVLRENTVSSTRIREALKEGRIPEATEFLGHPYSFEGIVVEGNKLGRTIGYPTANLDVQPAEKLLPANGVYAVQAELTRTGEWFTAMMNIGMRPTVGGNRLMTEVHLFDFNREIYGQSLRIYVHHRLREEQRFNGLDALKAQLALDAANSKAYFQSTEPFLQPGENS